LPSISPTPQHWSQNTGQQIKPMLGRFEKNASPTDAIKLLLDCCDRGARLPSILAICPYKRFEERIFLPFDIVLCHPVDADGERALQARLLEQETRFQVLDRGENR